MGFEETGSKLKRITDDGGLSLGNYQNPKDPEMKPVEEWLSLISTHT